MKQFFRSTWRDARCLFTISALPPEGRSLLSRVALAAVFVLATGQALFGQNATATWPLTSGTSAAVTGNLAAGSMTRGSGVNSNGYTTTNGFGGTGVTATSLTTAQSGNSYLQFSITAAADYSLSLSDISATTSVSAVAATNKAGYQVMYAYNAPSSFVSVGNAVTPTLTAATNSMNPALTVASGQTLYIRIYVWGLSSPTTEFRIKNFKITAQACPSVAAISYPKAAYCKDPNTTATATLAGVSGGSYSATPAGLSINSATGVVDVTASTAGTYTVSYTVVSPGCPNLVASTTIRINDLPTAFVLTGPDGATAEFCTNGTPATFVLSGSQSGVTYTFISTNPGGNNPPGQNFTVPGVGGSLEFTQTPDGKWSYSVKGTDDVTGCSNTMTGQLKAVDGPAISTQPPSAVSVCVGGGATTLTLNASNAGSLKWEVSTNNGSSWSTVANNSNYAVTTTGTTATKLVISNYTTGMNGYQYRVVLAGPSACPTNYSNVTTLTVSAPPVITTQPLSKTLCDNSQLTLSAAASNATTYQWYKNNIAIASANSPTYTTIFSAAADAGTYFLTATGGCGSVNSSAVTVTANTNPSSTTWKGPAAGGAVSGTDWQTAANWTCGVPSSTIDAVIPADVVDGYPTLQPTVTGAVRNLTINGGGFGAFLTVEGTLKIYGTATNSGGSFDASNGTIEFSGSSSQVIPASLFAANTVRNLVISSNVSLAGPLNLTGALSFGSVNNKTFATGDYLTLKSGAAATAMVADLTNNGINSGNSISGNVTVERYLPANRRYRLLTSPVTGATIHSAWQEGRTWTGSGTEPAGFGTLITGASQSSAAMASSNGFDFWTASSGASVLTYSGSLSVSSNLGASWKAVSNTNLAGFGNHEAYMLYVRGDRTVTTATGSTVLRGKGPLKEATSQSVPVYNQSHTLVGNPFAAPLNFVRLYNDNSAVIEPWYWTWQASLGSSTGGYVLVLPNGSGGYEAVPSSGTSGSVEPVISSGEGFFVVPKTGATLPATLLIRQTQKTNGQPIVNVFREAGAGPAKLGFSLFGPVDGQEILLDGAQARYLADASTGSSIVKPLNVGENLAVMDSGTEYIIHSSAMPKDGDTLRLQFRNLKAAAYTLEVRSKGFAVAGLKAVLVDRYAGTETAVSLQDSTTRYAFAVDDKAGSRDPLRFAVVYSLASAGAPTPKISRFSAVLKGGSVEADWVVENGETVQDCLLERSTDGGTFLEIGRRLPGTGAAGSQVYQAVDAKPGLQNAYRVQVRMVSGTVMYSEVATVEVSVAGLTVYPNPVREGRVRLVWNGAVAGAYSIRFVNAAGQVVRRQVVEHSGGTATYALSLAGVTNGSYMVVVEGPDGGVERRKVVVVR